MGINAFSIIPARRNPTRNPEAEKRDVGTSLSHIESK
jgi:hypothetical protein